MAMRSESPETASPLSLRWVFARYRWRILLTYILFNVENLLRLAQPLVLGWAINGLLEAPRDFSGIWIFVGQHIAHLLIGSLRKMYDTRAFTTIYTDIATDIVSAQRQQGVEVSRVAARSVLSREYVDFFEMHVPMMIRALYSVVGALVLLGLYDWWLVPLCLGLLLPALLLNRLYARQTFRFSRGLHDHLEDEVQIIEDGQTESVREHYTHVAAWRVKLSDAEALNFAAMEFFILSMMAGALVLYCNPSIQAGDIFAVFRYIMMFLMGMDSLPKLVHQLSRLKDIGQRMDAGLPPSGKGKRNGPGGKRAGKMG